jgi:hypothetical protein
MILGRVTGLTSSHLSPNKNHSGTAQWIRVVETNLAHDAASFHLHHAFIIVRSASHPVLRDAFLAVPHDPLGHTRSRYWGGRLCGTASPQAQARAHFFGAKIGLAKPLAAKPLAQACSAFGE